MNRAHHFTYFVYEQEGGVKENLDDAIAWYSNAADNGSEAAEQRLDALEMQPVISTQ